MLSLQRKDSLDLDDADRELIRAAVQLLPEGVYIAMNGRIHEPAITRKNVKANRFEKDLPG